MGNNFFITKRFFGLFLALALVFLGSPPKPAEPAPVSLAQAGTAEVSTMAYVDKDSGWLVVWAADSDTQTSG